MEVTFTIVKPADVPLLLQLMREYYAFDHLNFDERQAHSALDQFIDNTALGRAWLIHCEEATVGYLILILGFSFEYGGYDAFIDEVYIRETQRGRGIGKIAMRTAEDECRALGVHALHLEVERGNTNAQRLYHKAGFVNHDRYLMTKFFSPRE